MLLAVLFSFIASVLQQKQLKYPELVIVLFYVRKKTSD